MNRRSLDGVKVLEFAFVGVTPMTTKLLGVNGAEVIRVESYKSIDPLRIAGPYIDGKVSPDASGEIAHVHSDKYGITLNLKHPKALKIARMLVAWADIVADGFTFGALDRMGLGYEELKKINPDIIMISCNTFGQTGPLAAFPSTGTQLTGITGFTEISGWTDRDPVSLGYYTDYVIPHFNLITILAALDYKRRTGKGQHIDISQYEAGIYFSAPIILDYVTNNRFDQRHGNTSPEAAPHGVYRCHGNDKWCAISVSTNEEWQGFCKAIRNPEWTNDLRFSAFTGRKEHEAELNELIEKWTVNHSPREVMNLMQKFGVSAGVVQTGEEVFNDPHLNSSNYFSWTYCPGIDREYPLQLPFAKMSKTPAEIRMPYPMMGEHNEYVYTQLLGIPAEEFVELLSDGVFE